MMFGFKVGQRVRYRTMPPGESYEIVEIFEYDFAVDNNRFVFKKTGWVLRDYGERAIPEWPFVERYDTTTDPDGWEIVKEVE